MHLVCFAAHQDLGLCAHFLDSKTTIKILSLTSGFWLLLLVSLQLKVRDQVYCLLTSCHSHKRCSSVPCTSMGCSCEESQFCSYLLLSLPPRAGISHPAATSCLSKTKDCLCLVLTLCFRLSTKLVKLNKQSYQASCISFDYITWTAGATLFHVTFTCLFLKSKILMLVATKKSLRTKIHQGQKSEDKSPQNS